MSTDEQSLQNLARYNHQQIARHFRERAVDLAEAFQTEEVEASTATGVATFSPFLFGAYLKVELTFSNDKAKKLVYEATIWGLALPKGPSIGGYVGVAPERLIGDGDCIVVSNVVGVAITFFTSKELQGNFSGLSIGGAPINGGGPGKWRWA